MDVQTWLWKKKYANVIALKIEALRVLLPHLQLQGNLPLTLFSAWQMDADSDDKTGSNSEEEAEDDGCPRTVLVAALGFMESSMKSWRQSE